MRPGAVAPGSVLAPSGGKALVEPESPGDLPTHREVGAGAKPSVPVVGSRELSRMWLAIVCEAREMAFAPLVVSVGPAAVPVRSLAAARSAAQRGTGSQSSSIRQITGAVAAAIPAFRAAEAPQARAFDEGRAAGRAAHGARIARAVVDHDQLHLGGLILDRANAASQLGRPVARRHDDADLVVRMRAQSEPSSSSSERFISGPPP